MAVTIKNLLDLEIMKDFKIIAGEKGLERAVSATEILDFEFVREGEEYRERGFNGNSLVLSSLLFAKDNPELILQSIKKLISQNVQALAYKPVFFHKLPHEALAYAEQQNFPILEFGHDEFFEDIIFSIKGLLEKDDHILQSEPIFKEMLSRKFSEKEAEEAHESMNSLLRPVIAVACVKIRDMTEEQIVDMIRRSRPGGKLRSKTFVGKYKEKIFIILSQDEMSLSRFRAQLDDVFIAYGLMGREMIIGISQAKKITDHFDETVRQAYWAQKVGEIEKTPVKHYQDMGIYKLITSCMPMDGMKTYMKEYLAPLFEEEDREGDLLRTAIEYILNKGDTIKTAEKLYCHKNTVRYRIGKLQEKLDPKASEKEFYLDLAAAIKIYLLMD